jgi:hypothetical protein
MVAVIEEFIPYIELEWRQWRNILFFVRNSGMNNYKLV